MTHNEFVISHKNIEKESRLAQEIAYCIDKKDTVLFDAGAGAGKTYALIQALRHIIKKHSSTLRQHNAKILCITYTNAASAEITERLGNTQLVRVSTIHEFIWDVIRPYQNKLVEIHRRKVLAMLRVDKQKLKEEKWASQYRSLSNEAKVQLGEVIIRSESEYYRYKNKNAAEFRAGLPDSIRNGAEYVELLKSAGNTKKVLNAVLSIAKFQDTLESIISQLSGFSAVKYDARFNQDRLNRMQISHDTLLEYAECIVTENNKLRQIIGDMYPFILVDEYQDTDAKVIRMLKSIDVYCKFIGHDCFVGFFGDAKQNIYDAGIGSNFLALYKRPEKISESLNLYAPHNKKKVWESARKVTTLASKEIVVTQKRKRMKAGMDFYATIELKRVVKAFNRRSANSIIHIGNIIRNDKIKQVSIYDNMPSGIVKFYLLPDSITDDENIEEYKKFFISNHKESWSVSESNKLHCLELKNESVSIASGFGEIFDFYKSAPWYKEGTRFRYLRDHTLSLDEKKLGIVQRLLFQILMFIDMIKSNSTMVVDIIKVKSDDINIEELRSLVQKLKEIGGRSIREYAANALSLYHQGDKHYDRCMRQVFGGEINNASDIDAFILSELFVLDDAVDDESTNDYRDRVKIFLDLDIDIHNRWYQFVTEQTKGDVVYHTFHGTRAIHKKATTSPQGRGIKKAWR